MHRVITLLAAIHIAFPGVSLAAVLNDEVTSAKLKEADNSGSQDTNSGSGVKTNHIQNKAVTGTKMADGAVTATQLAVGAVTDAKIAGPISTSKLNVGTAAGTVAAGNHTHAIYQRKYANLVVVARSGGDFTDLAQAVASITDASETKPYLVKIMPGDYDAGLVDLKPYVSIEGSGIMATKLTNVRINSVGASVIGDLAIDNPAAHTVFSIIGPERTILRNLHVKAPLVDYLVWATDTFVDLVHVKIEASSDPYYQSAAAVLSESRWNGGGYNPSSMTIKDSDISVVVPATNQGGFGVGGVWGTGYGVIDIDSTSINIDAGQAGASGVSMVSSVSNSKVILKTAIADSPAFGWVATPMKAYNTYVEAPVLRSPGGGVFRCANVYGANLEPLCPAP